MTFLCLGATCAIYAQKLPNIQTNSMRASATINIDGKDADWGKSFQAYNHATDIFYSMANDDENLYLVVQTNDPDVLLKIFSSGITWSLQPGNSKDDNNQVSLTYPILPRFPNLHLAKKKYETEDTTAKTADLWMENNNKLLNDSCKFIRVYGVPGLDTLISIYNRDGIKTKGLFNPKRAYTCEFSIKLKLLNHTVNTNPTIHYRIRINGMKPVVIITMPPNPSPEMITRVEKMTQYYNKEVAPTFFQGEYTLKKK